MRKRVIILTTEPPDRGGGQETLVRELSAALESHGYSVETLHKGNCLPASLRSPRGRMPRYWADATLGWYQGKKLKDTWSSDVAAVISNSTTGYRIPRQTGSSVKLFHFYHGTYRGQAEGIRRFISRSGYWKMKWWDSMVLERLSGSGKNTLCVSDQVREEVARYFGQTATTVWAPLDTDHFRPLGTEHSRQTLSLPSDRTIGLFVGSAQPAKGFPALRSLIRALPDIYWTIALRGQIPPDLSFRSSGNLMVLQDVSYSQMPLLYSAADFTVCPSHYDAFSYSIAESLACGTPVIASPTGASCLFLVRPPLDRLLIPRADDVEAFTAAARELIRNPEAYREAVAKRVRPELLALLSAENWWARFSEVTGL